jgi:hypothetical protein
MPRIPTYGPDLIDDQALPGVRQSSVAGPEMFFDKGVAAVATGLGKLGEGLMDVAIREKKFETEARVKEADIIASDRLRKVLHDPEKGYLVALGKGAVDGRDAATQAVEDIGRTTMEGITDPVQQRAFQRVWAERRASALGQVDTHAGQQRKVYVAGQAESRAKMQIPDMVLNAASEGVTDPETGQPIGPFNRAKATLLDEIRQLGQLTGKGDDQIQQMQREYLTAAHTQIIQDKISRKDSKGAQAYFDKYAGKGEILDDRQAELRKALETANVHSSGLDLQLSVMKQFKSEKEQLAELDKQYKDGSITSEVRDNAKTRVEHDWSKVRAQKSEGDKAAMGQAQEWVLKNPGKSILEMPPNLYNWAKGSGHLAGLDGFATREGRPGERMKEIKVRGEMITTAMAEPDKFIEEFKRTGFADRMDLGVQGIKEMQNIAGDMIRGNGKYKSEFDAKIMQDAIPKALLANSMKDDRDRFAALQHEAQMNWKKANPGKTPTLAEQQAVANSANADWVQLNKVMWNSDAKAYQVQGKPDIRAVPKDFYSEMRKRNASNDEIMAAWQLKQKGGK